jgi:hypothetical protein
MQADSCYLAPGTGFPFRRFLRLAELQRRYARGLVLYSPRHWFPFSSPPKTLRAKVEVYNRTRVIYPQALVSLFVASYDSQRYSGGMQADSFYIAPGIGFPFRRLLRQAGLQWRYASGLLLYTPRHWFPFSSPPTTRRATVEVCKRTRVIYPQALVSLFVASYDSQGYSGGMQADSCYIPPGTGFAFRHLLRLAALQWRYASGLVLYSPRHWFPFSSPPWTRRTKVQVCKRTRVIYPQALVSLFVASLD